MTLTDTQTQIAKLLESEGEMTVQQVMARTGLSITMAQNNMRRLRELGVLHISGWFQRKTGQRAQIYKFGQGVDVTRAEAREMDKLNIIAAEARAKFLERHAAANLPEVPIASSKWTSTIHSKDYTQPHKEHIRFMNQFQPHPDAAAEWLFHEPKVELLGAKYE